MSETVFHFKHFTIQQDRSAMKVGTDGVLLGAWVDAKGCKKILDIGTGTGLIALMLLQKSDATVDAIEIDQDSFEQAKENLKSSPWSNRGRVIHSSLQDYRPGIRYDLIVSNPPYFIDSFAPSDEARNRARQAGASLSYEELLAGVIRLLQNSGKFCVILPSKEGAWFREMAERDGLLCNRVLNIRTKADKPLKRVIMEFSRQEKFFNESEIVLREEDQRFSESYKNLTSDFYPLYK